MNRPIKFRAWANHVIREFMVPWEKLRHIPEFIDRKDFTLMQFTGLKDKNGVEIYEGDIVNWVYEGNKVDGPAVVEYWEGDAMWTTSPILNGFDSAHCSHYEVIGNIYTNPELLK